MTPLPDDDTRRECDPSPEAIRQRCERLRAAWDAGRLAKAEGAGREFTVPEVSTVDLEVAALTGFH